MVLKPWVLHSIMLCVRSFVRPFVRPSVRHVIFFWFHLYGIYKLGCFFIILYFFMFCRHEQVKVKSISYKNFFSKSF